MVPWQNKAILNRRETLRQAYGDRTALHGDRPVTADGPVRLAALTRYLGMMPRHSAAPARRYITQQHLERVASGKVLGRDLTNDDGHIYIDISWYRHLSPEDVDDLCTTLESWPVKKYLGKTGQVVLLVKKPKRPITPANLRGITLASHISKVEPTAYFDTRDQEVCERVLGGPYIVGGMKGVSIVEVIRIGLFAHDMAMMAGISHDILLLDDEKYFDHLAQDGRAIIGAHIGLGTDRQLRNHTTGYRYIIPLGAWESPVVSMGAGVPQGSIQGVQAGNTCALPYVAALNTHVGPNRPVPLYSGARRWVDDTFLAAANIDVPRGLTGHALAIELPCRGSWWTRPPTRGRSCGSPDPARMPDTGRRNLGADRGSPHSRPLPTGRGVADPGPSFAYCARDAPHCRYPCCLS